MPRSRNILITSTLPSVNDVPHLANIIGSALSFDVFARYCRYGASSRSILAAQTSTGLPRKSGRPERAVRPRSCDDFHKIHADIYQHEGTMFSKSRGTSPACSATRRKIAGSSPTCGGFTFLTTVQRTATPSSHRTPLPATNNILMNSVGNLVNRVIKLINKPKPGRYGGNVPDCSRPRGVDGYLGKVEGKRQQFPRLEPPPPRCRPSACGADHYLQYFCRRQRIVSEGKSPILK